MSTTFLYLYDNYKIPYSIVIVSESGKFKLLENKVFDHSVKKKSVN